MKFTINTFLTSLLLIGLSLQPTSAAKLYKWVDENGVVSYQDSPPPTGSKIVKEEEISSTPSTQTTQVNTDPITVYTVESCESCELLLLRLQNWNIPTNEQSLQDGDIQARILETTESLQAPTIFINDSFVSDMSTSNLVAQLRQAGYSVEGTSTDRDTATDVELPN